jgi:hypothetical protein
MAQLPETLQYLVEKRIRKFDERKARERKEIAYHNAKLDAALRNDKLLKVHVVPQYGQTAIHPACPQSLLFAKMLNQKTLTQDNIQIIKDLGYVVQVLPSAPKTL